MCLSLNYHRDATVVTVFLLALCSASQLFDKDEAMLWQGHFQVERQDVYAISFQSSVIPQCLDERRRHSLLAQLGSVALFSLNRGLLRLLSPTPDLLRRISAEC